ncbi:MAG: hypothetical protein COT88_00025 [Candidatus Colwellbacteria bacterium CG10_big_fil_rev_8_21_14_0_10_41_28]|uniref:YdbS-like PH domain-containing protein n=1 Tax=Candidatus Colwellbacteria bacterium CG10_big_fil_rev_8_21_14_0_10_41_28 TaxID=1974539 RepID=A0A2H0VHY9_9BACT|nr:MAG: hypothetical protein COT88_00025 [Candidatus Colwellbacteria bacterium CG10_big_fil_rev_8_21_14_0_10_41_28]
MIRMDEGEKVLMEIRRHWYVLITESAIVGTFGIFPFFALLSAVAFDLPERMVYLVLFFSVGWLLVMWSIFFIIWTNYYLDVWIVTNRRVIDIEQFSLFSREVSEFRLDRVQDITIEVKGLLATLLKFGDLYLQTAGMSREFKIAKIPNPYEAKDFIMDQVDKALKEKSSPNGVN